MTTTAAREPAGYRVEKFPWLPILMLGLAGFLGLTIELSPAGLLNGIAAPLDLDLEQDLVVGGRDALPGSAVIGETLTGLGQQWMRYLVQRRAGRRDSLPEVFAQAPQCGPCPSGHR